MKKLLSIAALLAVVSNVTGCASTKAYLFDRGRDAADIFSISVGTGAGVKVRVSEFAVGMFAGQSLAGLGGGSVFLPRKGFQNDTDWQFLFCGEQFFDVPDAYNRHKEFVATRVIESSPYWMFTPPWFTLAWFFPGPQALNASRCSANASYYYTHIEVVAGAGITLRVGFNPGELVDFLLG